MTTTAIKLQSTPMAPYMGVMKSMNIDELQIVVVFLNETIREAEKTNARLKTNFWLKRWQRLKYRHGLPR